MNRFDYVKVLLYAYPKLEELADAVSGGVEVKAFLSFRARGDALACAEKIAEEIVIAKKLSLLKGELDRALEDLSERELFLLEYKYFRRKTYLKGKFAGFELDCSERNYFRLQNLLLAKIGARLLSLGRTEKSFFADFTSYKPFMRVYRAVREGRERAVVYKRTKRGIVFRQNSENSCCCEETGLLPRRTKSAIAATATAAMQITAICKPERPS